MTNFLLEVRGVHFSYTERPLLQDVSLGIEPGRVVGIVGPNGAGKTTLVNILSGLLTPARGRVELDGRPIGSFTRREIAHRLALIPPEVTAPFAYSVAEVVEMGRYPHVDAFSPMTSHDREVVLSALARTGLEGFESRTYNHLSSGERQRVVIARALAQEPRCLLMDEPTVHLDIHYQVELHRLMRILAAEGLAVLAISHDLNLASQFCDRLVLMNHGRIVRDGSPEAVLESALLSEVYRTPLAVHPHPETNRPTVWPTDAIRL